MNAALVLLLLWTPAPARAAAAEAARPVEAVRPRVEPGPARPVLPKAPARVRPLAQPSELRRLRADWSGRVAVRAATRAAVIRRARSAAAVRAGLARYRGALRREELELRRDRARAFDEMLSAPAGSPERKAWWTAVQAGTVMLEDYAAAFAVLSDAPGRPSPAAGSSPRGG